MLMLRLFIAIPVPDSVRKKIAASFPSRSFPGIRMVKEEYMHITAHFLGDVEESKVSDTISKLQQVAENFKAFDLQCSGLRVIHHDKKPAMIWTQFNSTDAFDQLCFRLRKLFPTEESRKPNPHLTVARIKQLRQLPFELPQLNPLAFIADKIELWKSNLSSEGSTYEILCSAKLQ